MTAPAYVTVNGTPAIEAQISRPRVGVWHADLRVDDGDLSNYKGPVTISIADGALMLVGTVFRSGVSRAMVYLRVAAGAAGLDTVLQAKAYQGVPLKIPLQDVLTGAGEQLAGTADQSVLGLYLPRWVQFQQGAGLALTSLLKSTGAAWRFLPDGTLWVGPESWPETSLPFYELLDDDPHLGRWEIAADKPTVDPGTTIAGRQISYVEHRITGDRFTHRLWFEG